MIDKDDTSSLHNGPPLPLTGAVGGNDEDGSGGRPGRSLRPTPILHHCVALCVQRGCRRRPHRANAVAGSRRPDERPTLLPVPEEPLRSINTSTKSSTSNETSTTYSHPMDTTTTLLITSHLTRRESHHLPTTLHSGRPVIRSTTSSSARGRPRTTNSPTFFSRQPHPPVFPRHSQLLLKRNHRAENRSHNTSDRQERSGQEETHPAASGSRPGRPRRTSHARGADDHVRPRRLPRYQPVPRLAVNGRAKREDRRERSDLQDRPLTGRAPVAP